MKKISHLGIIVIIMLLASCTNEDSEKSTNEILKGINVTIEEADFSNLTRSTYVVDPSRGFISSWSKGDIIGIYPLNGDQVAFPISEGEGSSTARFDGGSWALRSNVKYSAYYPFSKSNYTVAETEIPVSYTGQAQNGNNSTNGLSSIDYLAAAATQPNSDGTVDLTMKHLGAFVRFQLTMPKAATLIKAMVASDGTEFVSTGIVDLTALTPAITPKTTVSSFDISLSNFTCAKDEVVSIFTLLAPANLSTSKLTITLTDNEAKTYIYECNGSNFTASKSYNFTITETSGGTGATIEDAGWADGKENGHEYVDLGLPSGIKWATCNVGADKPEEYGGYFAWGATTSCAPIDEIRFTYGKSISWMQSDGIIDYKNNLTKEYDAASKNWGGKWRMPTSDEISEISNTEYCTSKFTTLNGVNGLQITSNINGKSIFIPAAGRRNHTSLLYDGKAGDIWSSTAHDYSYFAYNGEFASSDYLVWGAYYRDFSYSVRPVFE